MQLSLSEYAPNSLSGTWSAMFKNGESFSGPAVAGQYSSIEYGITLNVMPQPCATTSGLVGSGLVNFTLINVVVTSSRLTAVTGRVSCSGISSTFGTVNLSKQ